jgi:hypothetical protein
MYGICSLTEPVLITAQDTLKYNAEINGNKLCTLTEAAGTGESDKFSTVARSSSTLALIGAEPLLRGLISTWILRSRSSSVIKQDTISV